MAEQTLKTAKKGDTVIINGVDLIVKNYIRENLFSDTLRKGIHIDLLRAYCGLKEGNKYVVISNCSSCGFLYIKIKGKALQIRYKYLSLN